MDKCPAAIRHADNNGDLPIHLASGFGARSPEFCRLLIEAYPRSERTTNAGGYLPLHCACAYGTAATVKYLISLHPAGINAPVYNGFYPIHFAISGLMNRKDDPMTQKLLRKWLRYWLHVIPVLHHKSSMANFHWFWLASKLRR